ncbi:MAG: DNA primase [Gemmatimonadota bacterium]
MVSDSIVQEVRERADILEICGESVRLKRSGRTWRGPCPLHGGEGPNFSVDPVRGIFKCFVCGEGGDVFSFVMKNAGLDFPSAVRHVAERAGVEIPEENERREDPWAHLREALSFAAEWFAGQLLDETAGAPGRSYLAARGIAPEHWEEFGIGLAPDGWRGLLEAARARGISDDTMIQAGLVATSERAAEPYDRFRNRLMFAIHDLRSHPIAFGGRALGRDAHAPKYINSPESPVFHKGQTLYGLGRARHEMRREGFGLIGEGFMDVVSLHVHGFRGAVAPLGTALTLEQAELLARYTKKVYLLYDSDPAGLRATFRAGDALLAAGIHPLVVTLPGGEDPDSVLRERGTSALAELVADAVDVLDRKLQILERQGYLETIEGQRRAVDGLLSTLRAVRDPALRDLYLARAAEGTGVRRQTLVSEVTKSAEEAWTPRPRPAAAPSSCEDGSPHVDALIPATERTVLVLLLRDFDLVETADAEGLEAEHFRHPALRRIYEAVRAEDALDGASIIGRLPAADVPLYEQLRADTTEYLDWQAVFSRAIRYLATTRERAELEHYDRQIPLAEEGEQRRLLQEKDRAARDLRGKGAAPWGILRSRDGRPAPGGSG